MLVVNFFTTRVAASVLDFLFLEVIRVVVLELAICTLRTVFSINTCYGGSSLVDRFGWVCCCCCCRC